jgi:hypothetical protein
MTATGSARELNVTSMMEREEGKDKQVGSSSIRSKAPDLSSIGNVPSVLVGEVSSSELKVVSGSDLAGLDVLGDLLGKGLGLHPQPVVLVLRLGEGDH